MPTRRTVMKASGAVLLPTAAYGASALAASQPNSRDTGSPRADVPEPFSVRMPIPATLAPVTRTATTDFYVMTARKAKVPILRGAPTEVYGYNGQFPGPTIRATAGRRVVIAQTNQLDMDTAVHLHGGHTPPASDGFPLDVIAPGGTRVYEYPNRQQATTLWYHDHAHHMESEHVYRGLEGFYLIEDPREDALGLPSGAFDVPIMLRDARFDDDGGLLFVPEDFQNRTTILTNGRPQPYFPVAARRYRLRLLNGANLRTFTLRLGAGEEMVQISTDGGLLGAPVTTRDIKLSPGERVDVIVDFTGRPAGTQVILADDTAGAVLRFDVGRPAYDASRVPAVLRPLPPLGEADVVRRFSLGIDPQDFTFKINGRAFDPDRVDTTIRRGDTEVWEVTNGDTFTIPHNFHMHLVQFRVLSRNGQPPAPSEAGWKDTVPLQPGETVRLQATFNGPVGRYVYHCHLIDHSSHAMMATMEITE
ncbi:multicopper oxidase family protein [Actinoplanes sp. NPDC051346]|uniref:multicopper oxidase family protein n=1 Tax=Actinoplanes sp. NPDC051346 TaxID=3155048 RepID=UPI003413A244